MTTLMKTAAAKIIVGMAMLAMGSGCRMFQKSGDGGGDKRDPLLGRYIPKTDLPIPGRDTAKGRDPLLSQPASNGRSSRAEKDTFRNSKATSVASLAGRNAESATVEDSADRRTTATPMPRSGVPLTRDPAFVPTRESILIQDLQALGARVDRPIRDASGEWIAGASTRTSDAGTLRHVEARGNTAEDALRQLLSSIQSRRQ
jgi:hypothetical protein